ncbi:MAG: AGE family epimerase/isomerase [Pseudomonadota bacterium]
MKRPPLSMTVVMPAFNAERFIGEALQSLIDQRRRDIEVVVVDDGSSDATAAVVEKVADSTDDRAPEIRLIRQDNAGVSAARNRGIAAAQTPLVGFLDADDRWEPSKVARHLRHFEICPEVDLSYSGFRFVDEDGADLFDDFEPPDEPLDHATLLIRNLVQMSTAVVRLEAIEAAGGFDETLSYFEDYDLWHRVAMLRHGNIQGLRGRLVDYRRHGTQATSNWEAMHAAWRLVIERAAARDPEGWVRTKSQSWGNHLEYCAALAYNAGERSDARKLMLRAWRHGGPRMAISGYAQVMTMITVASLLPKAMQKPLGAAFLRFKRLKRQIADLREADRRERTHEPFNARDGLWSPKEATTETWLHDALYSRWRRYVPRPSPTMPFRRAPEALSAQEATRLAASCRHILDETLAPFHLDCMDRRYGGYLENADDLGFYDRGDKWLIKQSRNLWSFSYMARHGCHAKQARALADTGFAFLQTHFLDREHGGYIDRTRSDGTPLITVKLQRHQAHTITALCEYAALTGSVEARDAAVAVFETMEVKALDPIHGGYVDCLRKDWSTPSDDETAPHQTFPRARHMDAELHMLEAMTALQALAPGEAIRARLVEQSFRLMNLFEYDRRPANLFHHDLATGQPVRIMRENMHATYGHDLELIWFVYDALAELGIGRHAVSNWARRLSEHALRHSFDRRRGGFYDHGSLNGIQLFVTHRDKIWWVQAEALISMLELYRTTGETRYAEAFRRTLTFVEQHMCDPRGGWLRTVHGDGRPKIPARASANHGPYHSVRAMIRCASILDEFSEPHLRTKAAAETSRKLRPPSFVAAAAAEGLTLETSNEGSRARV